MIETFWVFLSEILGENIVASRGESVAAHTAVVLLLVCSLTCGGKTYDNVARTDVGIVDDIARFIRQVTVESTMMVRTRSPTSAVSPPVG